MARYRPLCALCWHCFIMVMRGTLLQQEDNSVLDRQGICESGWGYRTLLTLNASPAW